jgi:hypothetical protein
MNHKQINGGNNYTRKHLDRYGNVPIIRLAEMYLTRAEANFRNNTAVGAAPLSDINSIRTRVGLPALSSLTLDAITKERYLELAFEGHRYFDVRRWKVAATPEFRQGGAFFGMNMDQGTALNSTGFYQRTVAVIRAPWNRKNYFWPVPQSEIDRNKKLIQFPGY